MSDKQLIYRFFDVFNHRDPKKMSDLLTPDAELYFPKTEPLFGKERIFKFLNILFRQYPVLTFTVERVILQQNQAAVHWTNQGVDRRKTPYQNEGVTLLEIQDGKISFISDFFKNTDIF